MFPSKHICCCKLLLYKCHFFWRKDCENFYSVWLSKLDWKLLSLPLVNISRFYTDFTANPPPPINRFNKPVKMCFLLLLSCTVGLPFCATSWGWHLSNWFTKSTITAECHAERLGVTCSSNLSSPSMTAWFHCMTSENGSSQPLLSSTGIHAAWTHTHAYKSI